jgi:transposase-like protein
MSQHFLLSAAARTLSLATVLRMSDEEAHSEFIALRWADNDGIPYCPHCGCTEVYTYAARQIWKCKACVRQFSVTSGTIFASRKLPIRDYLAAIAIFCNAAKGISALQLGRDLDIQYKTAFVLAHKLREAISATLKIGDKLSGEVEVDGAYFGGHVKQENEKADRKDRRKVEEQTGKRQVVVILRERKGRALPFITKKESDGVPLVRKHVVSGTTIYADESPQWDTLHGSYETKRINHSIAYSKNGASTNWAESYFSRLRRSEIGQHHHISGKHLHAYADEMAWRENYRLTSTGDQWTWITGAALSHPVSPTWAGYWQRNAA